MKEGLGEKRNSVGSKTLMTIIIKHFTIKDDTAPISLNQHRGNSLKERLQKILATTRKFSG